MNYNKKRHLILKVLTKKMLEYPKKKGETIDGWLVGLTMDEVDSLLNSDKVERHIILSELIKSEEIKIFNTEKQGVFIEPRIGIAAYSDEKYIRLNNDRIKRNIKDLLQIIIPVLSLIIAVLALSIKVNSWNSETEKEIDSLEKRIEFQKSRLDVFEKKNERSDNQNAKDSLNQ
ncbi:hypothetical protein [Cellulophaga baltica]|uniref:Uncharacterized protein n=1 Tax=Cellulophaga baltica 18 TaxID=1348584 RepID=A0AAU8RH59_9FLAO|nr:hypothetical protein [Cellulophaga baltica]AIZ42458.1 hypothetical protein M666_13255 [Cellulophaga baltica 18]